MSFSGVILSAVTGQQVKNKMLYMWVINNGEEKTTVQQRKAIEIALVLFCVGTILFSWMTDMSLIKIPEELLMEISSIEDFLFTIFSVQASIATVSIAVISIISLVYAPVQMRSIQMLDVNKTLVHRLRRLCMMDIYIIGFGGNQPDRMLEEMLISGFVKYSFGVRKGTNISRHIHKLVAKLYRQFTSMILLPIQISVKVYLYGL